MKNSWLDSLKVYNKRQPTVWAIPKKDTPGYDFVKKVMEGRNVPDKIIAIEKKKPAKKNSMLVKL